MNIFALNVLLAVAWAALTGNITLSGLVVGFLIGSAALFVTKPLYPRCDRYFTRAWKWLRLLVTFLYDLFASSVTVVWDVLTPTHRSRPGIVSIPLEAETEMEVLLITDYISLTPGTLSLDVSEDCRTLYIHAMFGDDPDALRAEIKGGVERRVMDAMR